MTDDISRRAEHFRDNWLAWTALRHFLSVHLFRELACVIVERVSDGAFQFHELFEEEVTGGADFLASWLLISRNISGPIPEYLQRQLGSFTWQTDGDVYVPDGVASAGMLEKAASLGKADFGTPDVAFANIPAEHQLSFGAFAQAILAAKKAVETSTSEQFVETLRPLFASIDTPLVCAAVKHIGDLCADADHWENALSMYEEAGRRLATLDQPQWSGFVSTFTAVVVQSKAAARGIVTSVERASAVFARELPQATLSRMPLLLANASLDSRVATRQSSKGFPPMEGPPPTVMLPPLLDDTHGLGPPMLSWLTDDYAEFQRQFWAVLRRQLALGCATESRTTKAVYAWSIFEQIDKTLVKRGDLELFRMALRLVLESGRHKLAAQVAWSEAIVDAYVTHDCIKFAVQHATRYSGSLNERQRVLLELFAKWIEKISASRSDVAHEMLAKVAKIAQDSTSSFFELPDAGGRALKILGDVGGTRPELRAGVADDVAAAIIEKLRSPGYWTGRQAALDTATEYADIFSDDQLRRVTSETLLVLDSISPKDQVWPIVRPALGLLVSAPVKGLSSRDRPLGTRILQQIMRFGTEQETEHARVFFYLHDFDPALVRSTDIKARLQSAILDVRAKSKEINASNANEYIQALLLAPVVTGIEGVRDAVSALAKILESARSNHPSIALPYAYAPLLLLATEQLRIANDLSMPPPSFQAELEPIFDLVVELWRRAKNQPLLFSQFSLPPSTKPNFTVVHNWAFASLRFAKSLGRETQIVPLLEEAARQPALASPIALARTTLASASVGGKGGGLDVEEIRTENRETFYTALGARLALVEKLPNPQANAVCKALLDQCFMYGPRELDAALFLLAVRLNLQDYVAGREHSNYRRRLESNRELRMSLIPILELIDTRNIQ